MATAIINGIPVTGNAEEITLLILRFSTYTTGGVSTIAVSTPATATKGDE